MQSKKRMAFILALALILINLCGCLSQQPTLDFKVEDFRVPQYDAYIPEEVEDNHIMMASPVGSWTRDIKDDPSYGVLRSFDMRESTKWNPQANPGYVGNPGVVYLLDGYYDVDSWTMQFKGNSYYFDLLVSENGKNYTLLRSVTEENADEYFDENFLCTLEGLDAKHVAYVRIMFKGAGKNNPFINLHEMWFEGTYTGLGPVSIPKEEDPYALPPSLIVSHSVVGEWESSLATDTGYGPNKTYDSNIFSFWNPVVKLNYAEEPGIIYTLKGQTDVGKLQFVFKSDVHYFDVSVSQDGETFIPLAVINTLNSDKAYQQNEDGSYICTLDGLKLEGITHIQVTFTGRGNGSRYLALTEVVVDTEGTEGVDNSWLIPEKPTGEVKAKVSASEFISNGVSGTGNYVNVGAISQAHDGDLGSRWNPQLKNYTSDTGATFHLDGKYDLTKLVLTFGNPHYFKVLVSKDNKTFYEVTTVVDTSHYDETKTVCTLEGLDAKDVQYVQIILTGREGNSTWANFYEIEFYGIAK